MIWGKDDMGITPSRRERLVFAMLLAVTLSISVALGTHIGDPNSLEDVAGISLSGENSSSDPAWTQTSWEGGATGYPPEVVTGTTYNYCRGENEDGANGELKIALEPTGNKVTGDPKSAGAIDSSSKKTSIRFTAQGGDNLTVDNIRVFLHNEAGTSPAYNYGIQADDGSGYPDGTWIDNLIYTATSTGWQVINLPNDPTLTANNVYHIVVQPSGTPDSENHIALRRLSMHSKTIPYDMRTDGNQNVLFYDGTSWTVQDKDPIYVCDYTNATYRGQPYDTQQATAFWSNIYSGENFSISENKLLIKIGLYVCYSITPDDNIYWVVFNITDDTLVAEGLFATPDEVRIIFTWIEKSITPVRLIAGKRYCLYFKSPGSIFYFSRRALCSNLAPYRDLSYYGTNSFYIDSVNGGSTWYEYDNEDLTFYMTFAACKSAAWLESSVFDAGETVDWTTVAWNADVPSGTSLVVKLRSGSDNSPYFDSSYASDAENWSDWCVNENNTENVGLPNNRYVQYRIELNTTDNAQLLKLYDITLNYPLPAWHLIETWTGTVEIPDTTPPAAPTLLEPADGAKTADNTPTFRWATVTDPSPPVTYDLQVDDDSSFASPAVDETGLTNNVYTSTGLADENYSWRVRAVDNAGNASSWSSVWTLLVDATPPSAPTLTSPADNALIKDNTPMLDWTAVADLSGVTYDVQVDDDVGFSSPAVNATGVGDDNYQITTELADGVWYWHVRAVDGVGHEGAWSGNFRFTVSVTHPAAPTPLAYYVLVVVAVLAILALLYIFLIRK